jgi:phosphomannomutase
VSAHLTDLLAAARAWAADDPDAVTRDELVGLADAAEGGDEGAATELADAMAGMLEFGTAGLRGKLGGGPTG